MTGEAAPARTRRVFLQQSSGLTLAFYLAPAVMRSSRADQPPPRPFMPNAFVRIGVDHSVTVIAKYLEMGQGVFTGLATLLAEELDADWNSVRVEGAPADATKYADGNTGVQITGDSSSMADAHEQMRRAGATARAMLVAAAAQLWHVPAGELKVQDGVVSHPASQRATRFGALAALAAAQPIPAQVTLKQPAQYRLIGSGSVRRKDSHAKTTGQAQFTQDLRLPYMLIAVVAHPPRFGASVRHVDDAAAKAISGVVAILPFGAGAAHGGGVAVLARNTWVAKSARDALRIEWDESSAVRTDSSQLLTRYRGLAEQAGQVAVNVGDANAIEAPALRRLDATYEVPYLAHACMEPMNCLVQLNEDGVSIWNGAQSQTADQTAVAQLLGLQPAQVRITQLYAGGSFGRRACPQSDYVLEAVEIARAAAAAGHRVPIKLVWMREDDLRAGYYRPAFLHRIRAALDGDGTLVAWQQRIVGQSILRGTPMEAAIKDGIDTTSVEGAAQPYAIPNLRIELNTPTDVGIPVQGWRSVGHSHTAFATEVMIDELAATAGHDPYLFRRSLLAAEPRLVGVLDLAAEKAGWGRPLAAGAGGVRRGRGIALHVTLDTYVAQVAEVTVAADGRLRVERVVCAVDCGLAINPDIVIAQMQGGIGFGLGAALHSAVTLKDGVVEQSDFDSYAPLRMGEMPTVEVHIVPSDESPTGVGDPGVPPIAPAVVNAIYQATGQRIRTLPIGDQVAPEAAGASSSVRPPSAAAIRP